jgi:hypothetical protein
MAAVNNGQPVSLANVMTDALEMEADDPQFVPILQGLNDALRRDPNGCPPVPVVFCCAKRCRLTWAMCQTFCARFTFPFATRKPMSRSTSR